MTALRGAVLIYRGGCFALFAGWVTLYWAGLILLALIFPLGVGAWQDRVDRAAAVGIALALHGIGYFAGLGIVDGVPLHGHEVRWASAAACAFLWHGLVLGHVIVRLFISGYRSAKPRVVARIETAQRVVAAVEAAKHEHSSQGAVSITERESAGRLSLLTRQKS